MRQASGSEAIDFPPAVERPAKLRRVTTADAIFNQLYADIVSLRMPPGMALQEKKIAEEFGVSRTPVREAVHRLEMEQVLVRGDRGLTIPDPSPEEIALRLQMRLQRLDAMREAGARLLGRDRIGRDVFVRGAPEGLRLVRKADWQVRDFDLFAAYGAVRARSAPAMHVVLPRAVMTLEEALDRVSRMIGAALDWTMLESFLPSTQDPQFRRSSLASSFLAALELARRGKLDIAQDEAFGAIRLRAA